MMRRRSCCGIRRSFSGLAFTSEIKQKKKAKESGKSPVIAFSALFYIDDGDLRAERTG